MKIICTIWVVCLTAACGQTPIPTEHQSPVDHISQDAIQTAFRVLQRDYIRREDLTLDQLNRAALQGLLARLDFGAALVHPTSFEDGAKHGRVLHELLTPKIGYIRPLTVTEIEVAATEAALKEFSSKDVSHVILDLRTPAEPTELEAAAAFAELFLTRGELLFKLRRLGGGDAQLMLSKREPAWTKALVVLADAQSNNVAEILTAVLRQKKRALVIGGKTRGATVRYEEVPLDAGWRLRFASGEVLLADDRSVFRRGQAPDFSVPMEEKEKNASFQEATTGSIRKLVFEEARERFNERALVNGKNPELDDYVSRSAGTAMSYDRPAPRDKVLQRAVDLIQNIGALDVR